MPFDFNTLDALRQNHPAWRLLVSPHAPLILSFLHKTFIASNLRVIPQADLVEALEDELFALRAERGEESFPRSALEYLNDWAEPDKGWLRKFYQKNSDEIQFDLTPSTEKAIAWLETLTERAFIGTDSRLRMLFELLRQISEGSEVDPKNRIAELQKRRDAIDAEMTQVLEGRMPMLDATALKDRFMQFNQLARELLGDFRQVEQNFRVLDRHVRERIALWDGKKGRLLAEILGERDVITDSDQGKSFQAFWDFLMSPQRQEEFTRLLERMLALPPLVELSPDKRMRRIHYDWLEAGEHTQRTVAQLSQQLRRFLDDRAWLENRRIMEILHEIEAKALEFKNRLSDTSRFRNFMTLDETAADIELPLERPLFSPSLQAKIPEGKIEMGEEECDATSLFSQFVIDKSALADHIRHALQNQTQVSLSDLCEMRPLQQGLAELIGYLELAGDAPSGQRFKTLVDESVEEVIAWETNHSKNTKGPAASVTKKGRLPRVIYIR